MGEEYKKGMGLGICQEKMGVRDSTRIRSCTGGGGEGSHSLVGQQVSKSLGEQDTNSRLSGLSGAGGAEEEPSSSKPSPVWVLP